MQITSTTNRRSYWATVAVGVGIGVIYLVGFAAGGKPLLGPARWASWWRSAAPCGWPYDIIGLAGGPAYVGAVVFFRARG